MSEADSWITGGHPNPQIDVADGYDVRGDTDGQAAEATAANMAQAEMSRLQEYGDVTRCFTTPEGRAFLDYLRRMTIEQPAFFPEGYQLGQDGAVFQMPADQQGFIREGQNMIYRHIVMMQTALEAGPSENTQSWIDAQSKEGEGS